MHPLLAYSLLCLGLVGHVVVCVAVVNRIHAQAWPRWIIDVLTHACGATLVGLPALFAWAAWQQGHVTPVGPWTTPLEAAWLYVIFFAVLAVAAGLQKLSWIQHADHRDGLLSNHTNVVEMDKLVDQPLTAPGWPSWLARLPRNEVLSPHVHQKQLAIPRLGRAHAGVKIAHLSDLHMSGRIQRRYFEEIVRLVNDWQPDLIALTGDLVERDKCLSWIPETLGHLSAPCGTFFVLGNHDQRVDCRRLRSMLVAHGLTDVGSSWYAVSVRHTPVVICGNELPWFAPAADLTDCPPHGADGLPLRILLSHSPDQLGWAQQRDIDLLLAGHCHGGQVRFPLVGAILAPSVHGTRYSCGVFRQEETVMHVSRGTSGLAPFRWNCPPEVALLTLESGDSVVE